MKLQDMTAVLGVAAITMAVTLALAGPGRVEAIGEDVATDALIKPVIGQPTLDIAGIQVKLTMDKAQYAPGDQPLVLLEATNPTNQRVETKVWVGMTSSGVESMLSRVPTLPEYVWSETCPLALDPGTTKTVELKTGWKLAAEQMVSVTMGTKDQQAMMAKLLEVNRGGVTERQGD